MNIRARNVIDKIIHLGVFVFALLTAGSILLFAENAAAQNSAVNQTDGRARTTTSRRVFVRSKSLLVRGAVVEDKLLKNAEFKQLGLSITRDEGDADIILELRHDLLTMYVFSVVEVKTQTVIAGGKLSSLGGTVADKVAKRFVKKMSEMGQP
ncbi:MAG TPA: hypothetical protein VK557_11095 [Pyrinomonadaceae bacterium]|nr:hypothetical protein [Pyrinomonadaceae bacterium]